MIDIAVIEERAVVTDKDESKKFVRLARLEKPNFAASFETFWTVRPEDYGVDVGARVVIFVENQ
jgi:hypothetical protein